MIINNKMREIAANHPLGVVGTVNADGTPNVSPKGTMVVLEDDKIIFGEIRSPQTLANLLERPAMEINFVDVLARTCFRAKGTAHVITPESNEFSRLFPQFARWGDLANRIRNIICLEVSHAEIVCTPAYDLGKSEAELKVHWKSHYASLD
jgi:uncharacterized protein